MTTTTDDIAQMTDPVEDQYPADDGDYWEDAHWPYEPEPEGLGNDFH